MSITQKQLELSIDNIHSDLQLSIDIIGHQPISTLGTTVPYHKFRYSLRVLELKREHVRHYLETAVIKKN